MQESVDLWYFKFKYYYDRYAALIISVSAYNYGCTDCCYYSKTYSSIMDGALNTIPLLSVLMNSYYVSYSCCTTKITSEPPPNIL